MAEEHQELSSWETVVAPVPLPGIPDDKVGFYRLVSFFELYAGVTNVVLQHGMDTLDRESTSERELTIDIKALPVIIWEAIGHMAELLVDIDLEMPEKVKISAVEGVMLHTGLAVIEWIHKVNKREWKSTYEAFKEGSLEGLVDGSSTKVYSFLHFSNVLEVPKGITFLNKNDLRRAVEIAGERKWPLAVIVRLCLVASVALGEGLIPDVWVEMAQKEIERLVNWLESEDERRQIEKV